MLFDPSGVNLATLRTVKLSPALITWLFRKTCTTLRSSGLVSACKEHTRRVPPFRLGDAQARISEQVFKEHPHCPDVLSLRQNRPTLAGLRGGQTVTDQQARVIREGRIAQFGGDFHPPVALVGLG